MAHARPIKGTRPRASTPEADRAAREELRGESRYGVVDFIKVYYWPDKPWPTFNVADIALVAGVALLFIFLTKHGDAVDAKKDAAKPAA